MRKNCLVPVILLAVAGCGSSDPKASDRGADGLKQGLIASAPDSQGYVTSAFQGVRVYSATAMMHICVVLGIQSGRMPNGLKLLTKYEEANFDNEKDEATSLLLKDAANFWKRNGDIDKSDFYDTNCMIPLANMNDLYG